LDRKTRSGILEAISGAHPALLSIAAAEAPVGGDPTDTYVSRAIDEICRCYSSDLSLEDTAARLGISEGYLARVFRKKTGKTFFDYLTFVRMRQAMELLLDPAARIQEVAAAVGYTDQRNFSQRFRQIVGCTPTEFRQGKGAAKQ
ncbi:MAG TPA: AraC family transcriptional regulator, partial [Treponemataceae bacterium]|nr:AraC family transcriptional regulator [Treponemataceae bacterium]